MSGVGVATLLIHPETSPSIAIAQRRDFEPIEDVEWRTFWKREFAEDG